LLTKVADNKGTFDAEPGKKTIDHTETQGTQRWRLLSRWRGVRNMNNWASGKTSCKGIWN